MAFQGQLTPDENLAQALYPSVPATAPPGGQPVQQPQLGGLQAQQQVGQQLQQAPPGVGPPQNPQHQAQRQTGWKNTLEKLRNDPDMMMTLLTIGGAMMQNVQPGQSTGQHIAGAVGQGLSYQGRLAGLRQRIAERKVQQDREQQRVEQSQQRIDLEEERDTRSAAMDPLRKRKMESEIARNLRGPAGQVGTTQTLIDKRAKNLLAIDPNLSQADAWQKAYEEMQDIKRIAREKSNREAWRKIYTDLFAFGTPKPEDVAEARAMFEAEFGPVEGEGPVAGASAENPPIGHVDPQSGKKYIGPGSWKDPNSWE